MRALALRVPDLILVSALLSPRDEAEFTGYLRTSADTAHLADAHHPDAGVRGPRRGARRRLRFGLGRLMSSEAAADPSGCAPDVFADEIRAYLDRAGELQAQATTRRLSVATRRRQRVATSDAHRRCRDRRRRPPDTAPASAR